MTESILGARGHACPVACYISNVIQWHKEFPSYYLVSSTRFFQPFSLVFLLCQQFFSVSVDSSQFFCLAFRWFSFAFFNSILALLESQGPTLSTSNPPQILPFPPHHHHYYHLHQFPSQLRHFHRPFPKHFSSRSHTCWQLFRRRKRLVPQAVLQVQANRPFTQ